MKRNGTFAFKLLFMVVLIALLVQLLSQNLVLLRQALRIPQSPEGSASTSLFLISQAWLAMRLLQENSIIPGNTQSTLPRKNIPSL